MLVTFAAKFYKTNIATLNIPDSKIAVQQTSPKAEVKKYTVKEGEYLWIIAEEAYGSGFNAVDIAEANKITNPNIIEVGQVIVLPMVKARTPTRGDIAMAKTEQIKFTGDKYTVKSGDYLWKIALESYGDGYAWTRIWKANNISNPDIINVGNELVIPR